MKYISLLVWGLCLVLQLDVWASVPKEGAKKDLNKSRWGSASGSRWTITAYTDNYASNKHYGAYAAHGGKKLKWGMVAADWRVLKPGTRIKIEGYDEVFTVMDKGSGVKGKHIDIFFPGKSEKQLNRFGRKKLTVTILDKEEEDGDGYSANNGSSSSESKRS